MSLIVTEGWPATPLSTAESRGMVISSAGRTVDSRPKRHELALMLQILSCGSLQFPGRTGLDTDIDTCRGKGVDRPGVRRTMVSRHGNEVS